MANASSNLGVTRTAGTHVPAGRSRYRCGPHERHRAQEPGEDAFVREATTGRGGEVLRRPRCAEGGSSAPLVGRVRAPPPEECDRDGTAMSGPRRAGPRRTGSRSIPAGACCSPDDPAWSAPSTRCIRAVDLRIQAGHDRSSPNLRSRQRIGLLPRSTHSKLRPGRDRGTARRGPGTSTAPTRVRPARTGRGKGWSG